MHRQRCRSPQTGPGFFIFFFIRRPVYYAFFARHSGRGFFSCLHPGNGPSTTTERRVPNAVGRAVPWRGGGAKRFTPILRGPPSERFNNAIRQCLKNYACPRTPNHNGAVRTNRFESYVAKGNQKTTISSIHVLFARRHEQTFQVRIVRVQKVRLSNKYSRLRFPLVSTS